MLWKILRVMVIAAQGVVSAVFVASLIRTHVLVAQWVALIIAGLTMLLGLVGVLLFRRSAVPKIVGLVTMVAVCVGAVFAMRYTESLNAFLDQVSVSEPALQVEQESTPEAPSKITDKPFLLYISGIDSRNGYQEHGLSDVNLLLAVNPKQSRILLASVPRDTYVQLHGTTGLRDKLTHAGAYGLEMSRATLEDFLGVKIDYTMKVSFETVTRVVDELRGIEIYSDKALTLGVEGNPNKQCYYYAGTQTVDGDCALAFSRERKSYATGDKHRGENQQEVLSAIIAKLTGSRENLLRVPEILGILAGSFTTSFTRDNITDFLQYQLSVGPEWQVETANVDGVGDMLPTYTMGPDDPRWVMLAFEDSVAEVSAKIKEYLQE